MPAQNEKIIVFDEDGNPKELRYYEAEKLVARLGTILDGDNNFIGLRELDVEAVSPSSWFDKLRHKPQPKRIDILTVDFIGLINWINTIKTIKTIEDIENVDLINEIALVDTITDITNIDNITNLENVGTIGKITSIESAQMSTNPIRNSKFTYGFEGWTNDAPTFITREADSWLGIRIKFNDAPAMLKQFLFVDSNKYSKLAFWAYRPTTGGANLRVVINFTDLTWQTTIVDLSGHLDIFLEHSVTIQADKTISRIGFQDNDGITYFGIPMLVESDLVKGHREDLLLKHVDFTANAALQSYLAAVNDQKHKVYAYGFESDADGTYYFSATVGGSAFQFGRRITKGVMLQTFVHPVVCDVNTALNFMCATGNAKTWIQYKTEA